MIARREEQEDRPVEVWILIVEDMSTISGDKEEE